MLKGQCKRQTFRHTRCPRAFCFLCSRFVGCRRCLPQLANHHAPVSHQSASYDACPGGVLARIMPTGSDFLHMKRETYYFLRLFLLGAHTTAPGAKGGVACRGCGDPVGRRVLIWHLALQPCRCLFLVTESSLPYIRVV